MNQGSLVAIAPCLFSANAQRYWQCICFYVLIIWHLRMRRCIVQLGLCLATSLQEPAADTHLSTANDPVTGPCFVYCGELLLIPFATRSNVHASYSTVDGMASHLNIILCFPLTHALTRAVSPSFPFVSLFPSFPPLQPGLAPLDTNQG